MGVEHGGLAQCGAARKRTRRPGHRSRGEMRELSFHMEVPRQIREPLRPALVVMGVIRAPNQGKTEGMPPRIAVVPSSTSAGEIGHHHRWLDARTVCPERGDLQAEGTVAEGGDVAPSMD